MTGRMRWVHCCWVEICVGIEVNEFFAHKITEQ